MTTLAADLYLRTGLMPLPDIHAQPARRRVLFSEKELRSLIAYVAALGPGPPIPKPEPAAGNLATGFSLAKSGRLVQSPSRFSSVMVCAPVGTSIPYSLLKSA